MADFLPEREDGESVPDYNKRCAVILKAKQEYWAKVLRVQDWDIKSTIISREEMHHELERDGCVGFCTRDRTHKEAYIALLVDKSSEDDFVHEMLHIVLDDVQARAYNAFESVESRAVREALERELKESLERTINMLSGALLKARDGAI